MDNLTILKEIDRTIKQCWKTNIQKDWWTEYLLREDSLKCALYFHLRKKLDIILRKNNLRIYPEFYFQELKYKADLAIVRIDENKEYHWLGDAVTEVVALFELKYTGGEDAATINWIKNDLKKFHDYMDIPKLSRCQFYFAVIYESERNCLNWLDTKSKNNWAKGRVTELDAGYINDEMIFEVFSYNGWNEDLNDAED